MKVDLSCMLVQQVVVVILSVGCVLCMYYGLKDFHMAGWNEYGQPGLSTSNV